MIDVPEDQQPHPVEGITRVPICDFCMRPVSLAGPDYQRWEHDEDRLNPEEQ